MYLCTDVAMTANLKAKVEMSRAVRVACKAKLKKDTRLTWGERPMLIDVSRSAEKRAPRRNCEISAKN